VRVSVVIPCHNAAAFLDETLASVQAQTRAADEIIVVDDRSTDRSAAIARARGALVLSSPTPGQSAARNVGCRRATGELIAFLDADDRWLPHHLEVVAPLLEAHPDAVLAFGGLQLFGLMTGRHAYHRLLPSGAPVDARVLAAAYCVVPQMAVIIRHDAYAAVGGYDETVRHAEDFELFARLSRRGPFVSADAITAEYRQHPSQITRDRRLEVSLATVSVRYRNWVALRGELPAEQLRYIEEQARREWDRYLRVEWREWNRTGLDALLAAAPLVPGSAALERRWRVRARLGWQAWCAVRPVGRALHLRSIWNATVGRRARRTPRIVA
jgi:glycosyltransferase involved in cell wall biosynthesis